MVFDLNGIHCVQKSGKRLFVVFFAIHVKIFTFTGFHRHGVGEWRFKSKGHCNINLMKFILRE